VFYFTVLPLYVIIRTRAHFRFRTADATIWGWREFDRADMEAPINSLSLN
jgi:hypothetical protein